MKILYHWPNPSTIYAGRTIANGYKNAFKSLGHFFSFLTPQSDQLAVLVENKPDIFITSLNPLSLRFLSLDFLHQAKKNGTKVFVQLPFWDSPINRLRINETKSLKDNTVYQKLISSNRYGDIYFAPCESNDERMTGFKENLGIEYRTLLLAADDEIIYPESSEAFQADISYIGTNLPGKRELLTYLMLEFRNSRHFALYGQDWTLASKIKGYLQRIGQYGNIPVMRSLVSPQLGLQDERKIYTSSTISINIHEEYQKIFGDINERTFKIPLAGGFQIVDSVSSLGKYFTPGEEIVVAESKSDWVEKINYYLENPEDRRPIIEAGMKKVKQFHTYKNRVKSIMAWYKELL